MVGALLLPGISGGCSVLAGKWRKWIGDKQDVNANTSIPASTASKNGMKPAVDQSLSKITYLFSLVSFAANGVAEIEAVRDERTKRDLKNCISDQREE